ncbi:MAG: hypothetical protein JOS17DRAFT_84638 [Linnemannia elongata]|nr:MAG: hypothetical protein JOS17DRAFT_84638 [Linnemannia elongata]
MHKSFRCPFFMTFFLRGIFLSVHVRCVRWWQRAPILIRCLLLHTLWSLGTSVPRYYFFPFVCLAYVLLLAPTHALLPACPFLSPFSLSLLSSLTSSLLSAHPHSFSFSSSHSFAHSPLFSLLILLVSLSFLFNNHLIQPTLTLSFLHPAPTLATHPFLIAHAFITLNNHKKNHNNSRNNLHYHTAPTNYTHKIS